MPLLGPRLEDRVPPLSWFAGNPCRATDGKTVWLYHEALAQGGMMDALFKQFERHLAQQG